MSREGREIKHLKAKLARSNATIASLEAENDALSARLHDKYSDKLHGKYPKPPAAECSGRTLKDWFWRRYVNGGSGIWRTLFEICDGGGRLWRAVVRVGRRVQ